MDDEFIIIDGTAYRAIRELDGDILNLKIPFSNADGKPEIGDGYVNITTHTHIFHAIVNNIGISYGDNSSVKHVYHVSLLVRWSRPNKFGL